MMFAVSQIVDYGLSLPAPPRALAHLTEIVDRPHHMREIAGLLRSDATLSARLLSAANSPIYGIRGGTQSIDRALVVLGEREVVRLAIAESARMLQQGNVEGYAEAGAELWRKSLHTALFAEALSAQTEGVSAAAAYTAGLLADVGKLALSHFMHRESEAVRAALGDGRYVSFDELERHVIGADHAAIGAAMAESWGLPPALCAAIKQHHSAHPETPLALVVHCADTLGLALAGGGLDGLNYPAGNNCLTAFSLTQTELDLMIFRVSIRAAELEELYA